MSIEITIYADASARAVAAARSMFGEVGPVYSLPHPTPTVGTPPMGLLAVPDDAGTCIDWRETFDEDDPPAPASSASWTGEPHPGLPEGSWGSTRGRDGQAWPRALYPTPSLRALGVLSRFAAQTGARVWVVCDHERGDTPYDEWAWLFAPARPRSAAYQAVFAYRGDAGQVLWQRDLIGPDPWRVLAEDPGASPSGRLARHLGLRGGGLPGSRLVSGMFEPFRLAR